MSAVHPTPDHSQPHILPAVSSEVPDLVGPAGPVHPSFGRESSVSGVYPVPAATWYDRAKRLGEAALAVVGLLVLGPVILLAAALVKLTSKGPAFYTQRRVGLGGRPFTIYKLRTMRHDAEAGSGAIWAKLGDRRVTRLGRFLRTTHIDEFPQLLNVLLGHMSLIGPRPERPEIVKKLQMQIDRYQERHRVRPGITGLAQVQLPPDSGLHSVRKKLVCDLCYIENRTVWLDFRLMLCTGLFLFGVPMYLTRRLLRIPEPLAAATPQLPGRLTDVWNRMETGVHKMAPGTFPARGAVVPSST